VSHLKIWHGIGTFAEGPQFMTEDATSPPSLRFADLLKPEEAARKLRISKSHLRELTVAGRIPAIDFAITRKHMWRYHAPTLEAWLQKQMRMVKDGPASKR